MSKNNDLEFVSISAEDEDNNNMATKSYSENESSQDTVLGSWILKQSKVHNNNNKIIIFLLKF